MIDEQIESESLNFRKEYNKHITFVDKDSYMDIMANLIKITELISSHVEANVELGFMYMQQVLPDNVYSAIAEIINTQLIVNRYTDKTLLITPHEYRNDLHYQNSFEGFFKHDVFQTPIPYIEIEISHGSYQAKSYRIGSTTGVETVRFQECIVLSMQIFFKIAEYNYAEFELYYPLAYHFDCQSITVSGPKLADEMFTSISTTQMQTDVRQTLGIVLSQIGKVKDIETKVLPFSYNIADNTAKLEPYTLDVLNQIKLF